MGDDRFCQSPSLGHRVRSTFSCCFGNRHHGHHQHLEDEDKSRLLRAPSAWLRSRANEFPEFRGRCRSLISRKGKGRRHSADFSYDPSSYALNFDEGPDEFEADEFPLRNMSLRFPPTPPPPKSVSSSLIVGEIVCL